MHNYHTEDFYFHANGDPIPGDVLIKKIDNEDTYPFRTTAEEIVTFCAALRLHVVGSELRLRTTHFKMTTCMVSGEEILNPDLVKLIALAPQYKDALYIFVPTKDLQDFAAQALQRRFELYLEDRFSDDTVSDTMVGIGLFVDLS